MRETTPLRSAESTPSILDRILIAGFGLVLLAPTIDRFLRSDAQRAPTLELRPVARPPTTPHRLLDLLAFPRSFEAHWNDTFGLRDKFLRWHSIVKLFGLSVAPSSRYLIGKDGWIFLRSDSVIDTWRGVDPFTTDELESWRQRIESRQRACAEIGARYLFVIAPDKPEIYPEYVPKRFAKVGPSRIDQLYEYLATRSKVEFLDLRPCLIDAKKLDDPHKGDFVYYPRGAHWQTRGAIAAMNVLFLHLSQLGVHVAPMPLEDHRLVARAGVGDSDARTMYVKDLLPQAEFWWTPRTNRQRLIELSNPRAASARAAAPADSVGATDTIEIAGRIRITEVDDSALPRAVVLHDSFATYFERSLSESFSRLAMFWTSEFDRASIAAQKPDAVIELYVERALVLETPR